MTIPPLSLPSISDSLTLVSRDLDYSSSLTSLHQRLPDIGFTGPGLIPRVRTIENTVLYVSSSAGFT